MKGLKKGRFYPHYAVIARRIAVGGLLLLGTATVHAQSYPNRLIHVSYPYQGGTAGDAAFRSVLTYLEKTWGQPVVMEFRIGGNEVPNLQAVLSAPADGYFLAITSQNFSVNPAFQKLPFELKEFAPITMIATLVLPLIGSANSPAKTLKDFIAYAKANPGKANIGYVGNYQRISLAILAERLNLQFTALPFKGAPDYTGPLVSGLIDATFSGMAFAIGLEKDKRVNILAVATPARVPELPNVPALAEVAPGFTMTNWNGFVAKANVPRPILEKWNAGSRDAVKTPEVIKAMATAGFSTAYLPLDEMAAYVQKETETIAAAARKVGIVPE